MSFPAVHSLESSPAADFRRGGKNYFSGARRRVGGVIARRKALEEGKKVMGSVREERSVYLCLARR